MIEYRGVTKVYDSDVVAVDNANLTIGDGEFVCFIGTSGSGKTTALRLINRMHDPTEGDILIDGEDIQEYGPVNLRRKIGYVIQQTGLFPHMTVYENVVTVPRLLEWDEEKCRSTAERLMERVDLPVELLDRYPSELSGGQQQRIGVIRALAANPGVVLMDEPFGALDPITRDALHELVIELQEEYNNTFVFVTHDMDEALKLADRIAIWHEGKVIQYDTPENILSNPANDYVRSFIGQDRLFDAKTNNIRVKEVMNENVLTVTPGKTVSDALSIMHSKRVDTLFVVDDYNKLLGRITIEQVADEDDKNRNVMDIIDREVRPLHANDLIQNKLRQVLRRGRSNIPVVDRDETLIGIITKTTLVNLVYNLIWDQDIAQEEILEEGLSE
ncbi:ABC transporter ATP-binding protein [Carnobacteriaceae bacterium 52-44]